MIWLCLLRMLLPNNNSVAFRIGGDEFALLHQYASVTELESILQDFNYQISKISRIGNEDIKVRVSVGVSTYKETEDKNRMCELADKRMYEDKMSKKG